MKTWLILAGLSLALAGCSGGGATSCSGATIGGSTGTCGTDGGGTTTTVASDLIVAVTTSAASGIQNTGSDTATLTVTAVDANRNALPGVTVQVVPDDTAVATVSASTTDSAGVVTATIGIGSDRSNRSIAVVVRSGTVSKTVAIPVTGAKLTATLTPAVIAPGASGQIVYHLVDASGNVMPGVGVSVSGAASGSGLTDVNGNFELDYTAPGSEGQLEFDASAAGVTLTSFVKDSVTTIPAAVGTVRAASLSANPSSIGINENGSTANQVDVRALFLTDNNVPMQNVRVRFDLDGDPNSIGGSLVSGDNIVYTDANGVARTTYIPGSRSSGNQAVTIRGCYSNDDFAVVASGAACPNGQEVTANVTVADPSVSLSIFSDNLVTALDDQQAYQIAFSVQVVDSVGNPKPNVAVAHSIDLPRYFKGQYVTTTDGWALLTPQQSCDNEDLNRNGNRDTFSNGDVEDANGDGVLQPAASDATIVPASTGSDVTDAFGRAHFYVQYGKNIATWADYTVKFTASVAGSEGIKTQTGHFLAPADVFQNTDVELPFHYSPYGKTTGSGYVTVTDPSPTAINKSGLMCTFPASE